MGLLRRPVELLQSPVANYVVWSQVVSVLAFCSAFRIKATGKLMLHTLPQRDVVHYCLKDNEMYSLCFEDRVILKSEALESLPL